MFRAFLLGTGAAIALTCAASGAAAKAPPCKDSKGRVVPCPQKGQPTPQPSGGGGGGGGGCLALMLSGALIPCYAQ